MVSTMSALYKKVLLTGMVVLVAFVITIGSTFAWFTLGQTAEVTDMNLTINSSESILILMDNGYSMGTHETLLMTPTNYKSILTNSDITSVYDFMNAKIFLKPVTSTNGLSITRRDGTTPATFAPNVTTPGEYIEFSVWLLSQSVSAEIGVSNLTVSVPEAQLEEKAIVINAARLSIDGGSASNGTKRIFGLNKDYGFAFDVDDVGYDGVTPANNAIVGSVATNLINNHHALFHTDGPTTASESVSLKLNATHVLDLVANTPTKVTIRIWIEGWDAQANNNLIGAVFNIAFSFIAIPQS